MTFCDDSMPELIVRERNCKSEKDAIRRVDACEAVSVAISKSGSS